MQVCHRRQFCKRDMTKTVSPSQPSVLCVANRCLKANRAFCPRSKTLRGLLPNSAFMWRNVIHRSRLVNPLDDGDFSPQLRVTPAASRRLIHSS